MDTKDIKLRPERASNLLHFGVLRHSFEALLFRHDGRSIAPEALNNAVLVCDASVLLF